MSDRKKGPEYTEILDFIAYRGLRMRFIWEKLSLSQAYFYQILHGIRPMPDIILAQINAFLGTDFKHPEPTPEILPHEQLELDRQSLKDKPLFKDENNS